MNSLQVSWIAKGKQKREKETGPWGRERDGEIVCSVDQKPEVQ